LPVNGRAFLLFTLRATTQIDVHLKHKIFAVSANERCTELFTSEPNSQCMAVYKSHHDVCVSKQFWAMPKTEVESVSKSKAYFETLSYELEFQN